MAIMHILGLLFLAIRMKAVPTIVGGLTNFFSTAFDIFDLGDSVPIRPPMKPNPVFEVIEVHRIPCLVRAGGLAPLVSYPTCLIDSGFTIRQREQPP